MIGENAQEMGRLFEGQIDEVRIWNTARTQAEIQANMNITLQGNESGLVAYYPFDALLTSDQTSNTNDGTLINSSNLVNSRVDPVGPVDSIFKTALSFDGIDDYVSIPDNANLQFGTSIDFTVEFLVKTTTDRDDPSMLSNKDWNGGENQGFVFAQTGSTWKFNLGDGSDRIDLEDIGAINDGLWHHLAVTVDRDGEAIAYQDGVFKTSTTSTNSFMGGDIDDVNSGFGLKIAQDGTGNFLGTKFLGQIDEVRVWNTVRTQEQIQANMNTTLQGNEAGLVAYYPLDKGIGTHIIDQTNHNNDGTFVNAPTWVNNGAVSPIEPVQPVEPVQPNIPPTITGTPPTTAKVGWIYRFTPTASDSEGDTLSFSITHQPDWANFYPRTGTLSGIPTDEGTHNIEISVSDGAATATLAAFDLTIKKVTLFNASTIHIEEGPKAIAINPQNNQIYLVNEKSDSVTATDSSGNLENTIAISVGVTPTALAINPQTHQIYVVNERSNNVMVIDGDTNIVLGTIKVGTQPSAIAINPQTHQIYVINDDSDNVTVIDGFNNTTTVDVGSGPRALAINPQTHQIYVANYASDNVTVITPSEKTYLNPMSVEMSPIPDNETSLLTPLVVSLKVTDAITQIYYQITGENENKGWIKTTLTDNNSSEVKITQLPRGDYFIHAVATDAIMETSLNNATGTNSPFIGEISTSSFTVVPSPIILDNTGDPHLIEINEDIEATENTGTKISDLLATGANNNPIADGDYDAVKGIAVIAVDNTNGTWEYSLHNGESWAAFGTPSETEARLLLIDGPNTRIRFRPNMNFEGSVEQGLTFRAWEQQTGGGDNGGIVDITAPELDPYALSPETETASITVIDIPEQFTGLYLETSAATILNRDTLDVIGKLSVFPETGENLSNYDMVLTITAPDGTTQQTQTTTTHTDTGQFEWKDLSLPSLFTEMQEGAFGFQATFAGTAYLTASNSALKPVLVGASAGYAILVQGKIANEEGLAAHNKTLNRIYKKFKERGFEDDNIKYFNYDTTQDGVDGLPIKADIAAAFTELQSRMNSNPAPFYVVMIDHGGIDGIFHIYNGNNNSDDVLTSAELADLLSQMEAGLSANALLKPRIVMLGACYSGSFIPELSKTGRIIITSATAQEESYKGPEEPNADGIGIRSGEFFMDEFFARLGRSDNIKAAFELATGKTETFTRRGDGNTANRFYDNAMQHPLLDDNGDGQGSNTFTANADSDGFLAQKILLGIGLNYDTNTTANPAEILSVSNTVYLSATESTATLEAKVNNANHINSAPVDIRKPSLILNSTGTEASEQLEITNLPRRFMSCSSNTNVCMTHFDQFTESGMYEAFYFVRDSETNDISPVKRSVVYKNYADNQAPNAFDLVEPLDGSEPKTTLIFKWDSSTDSDGPVTYNFILAKDASFSEVVSQQEELETAMTYVDETVALADQTPYYWKVEAVDPFGEKTTSRSVFSFNTNNTNAPPSIASLHVSSGVNFSSLDNAIIDFWQVDVFGNPILDEFGNPIPLAQPPVVHQDQGFYNMLLPFGRRRTVIHIEGFEDQAVDLDTSEGLTRLNVEMVPIGGIPTQPGQLQLAADRASVAENEGTVTILVERVEGSDGVVSIDYATACPNSSAPPQSPRREGSKEKRLAVVTIPIPVAP
ncbi:conserved hypothetical protein [Beggiatoa sp. PS]|nr:conserved hypothetical protein [Beggiatoa sp. PS]